MALNHQRSLLTATSRVIALLALISAGASLMSCSAPSNNAFLGAPYDGPTAAYGYNLP
jgi:hypothetical protein